MSETTPNQISITEQDYNELYHLIMVNQKKLDTREKLSKPLVKLSSLFSEIGTPSATLLENFPEQLAKITNLSASRGVPDEVIRMVNTFVSVYGGDANEIGHMMVAAAESGLEENGDYYHAQGFDYTTNAFAKVGQKGLSFLGPQLNEQTARYVAKTTVTSTGSDIGNSIYNHYSSPYLESAENRKIVVAQLVNLADNLGMHADPDIRKDRIPFPMLKKAIELSDDPESKKAIAGKLFEKILQSSSIHGNQTFVHNAFFEESIQQGWLEQDNVILKLKEKINRDRALHVPYEKYIDLDNNDHVPDVFNAIAGNIHYVASLEPDYLLEHKDFITHNIKESFHVGTGNYQLVSRLCQEQLPAEWKATRSTETLKHLQLNSAEILEDIALENEEQHVSIKAASYAIRFDEKNEERKEKMMLYLEKMSAKGLRYASDRIIELEEKGFLPNAQEIYSKYPHNETFKSHLSNRKANDDFAKFGL